MPKNMNLCQAGFRIRIRCFASIRIKIIDIYSVCPVRLDTGPVKIRPDLMIDLFRTPLRNLLFITLRTLLHFCNLTNFILGHNYRHLKGFATFWEFSFYRQKKNAGKKITMLAARGWQKEGIGDSTLFFYRFQTVARTFRNFAF